ncbi:maestro heat-like repeat-containing protein family member 2A [Natator depressus]|uniref:maestro heat-like repeat-containing protein family member 2A n=1 Tax=Natator depressus TaxID=27790 RepID=UPI003EBCAD8F
MLHVRDPSPEAATACYAAFQVCAPFIGLTGLGGAFDSRLLTGASGERHEHLMGHVCKQLAQKDPVLLDSLIMETCLHLHSHWEGIRLAAAKLAGETVPSDQHPDGDGEQGGVTLPSRPGCSSGARPTKAVV